MRLNRLCIEQFRQFRQPLDIRDLAPGVNLIVGPNESGKSTVVRAIRAAFLERYKSSSVEDLLPWGDSASSPTVSLEFEWQGQSWRLAKSFLRRPRCDLDVSGQAFSGEAAEEKLADLLGYQFPGRGASKAEHWGIPGLLWIEQGAGQDIGPSVHHAASYLKSVLDDSLGEVASSAGDALMDRVEQEWLKLFTARKQAPTGDYAAVLKEYEECRSRLQALDADVAAYRQQVDRLAELRAQQHEDAQRPWESYRQQAARAKARLSEVEDWVREQERDGKALEQVRADRRTCLEQLEIFAHQQNDLAGRERAHVEAVDAQRAHEARAPQVRSRLEQAQQAYQAAELACQQAYRHERLAALRREQQRVMQGREDLQQRLERAGKLLEQLKAYRADLQPLRVDAPALKRLRSLAQQRDALNIEQQSVATRLRFDLQPEGRLQLGDDVLEGQGERLLLEPVALDLPGLGRLEILPGGQDLADLARRRQAAESALHGLLDELRVTDLAQAEAHADRRKALQGDIHQAEVLFATLAPEGAESLAAGLAQATDRLSALRAEQEDLAVPSEEAMPTIREAEAARDGAREALRQAEQAAADHDRDLSLARQAADNAQAEWHRLRALVESPEHQARKQALSQRLVGLDAQEAARQAAMDRRQREIQAAQPDILAQDVQRFSETADAMASAAGKRSMDLASLQSRLEVLGASALEERRAETFLRFQYLERRRDELKRRGAALDLLLQLLRTKRQALTRRIQAPLQRRLEHYLQLLFAQARLSVDEELVPDALVRADPAGETRAGYAALSFGAREQMGLISRLAYADLLREAGRPTLIILDDALVHSDAARLAQMKRILFDAAQRHQILLFSCHPDRWLDLGVIPRDMNDLKQRSTL